MAQTTKLAAATAEGTSTTIVVDAGVQAVIGLFASVATLGEAGPNFAATVQQITPGTPNNITKLSAGNPSCLVSGPNTYQVVKPGSLVAVGVFSE